MATVAGRDYTHIDDIITRVRAMINYTTTPYEVINKQTVEDDRGP